MAAESRKDAQCERTDHRAARGNLGGGDKSLLEHTGDFFGGVWDGASGDVEGLLDTFTSNLIDTLTETWRGVKEDPLSLLISKDAREAWPNGDYGTAFGRGTWDIGSWFIPGAGWAAKAGKLGKPDKPRNDSDTHQADGPDDTKKDRAGCTRSSFLPGTPVLLANGSTTPIQDVEQGDEVLAFNPLTGQEGPREVTGTGEKTLVDITVDDGRGGTGTLTATAEHPFWAPEPAGWVEAAALEPGTRLRTSTGTWTQATAVETQLRRELGEPQVRNTPKGKIEFLDPEEGRSTIVNSAPPAGPETRR